MTLKKLNRNQKGFTLIELMIVIAIIGILAAIAIPNYISYRDKSFCSATESDANALASGLADYFAIPSNRTLTLATTDGQGTNVIHFHGAGTISLSGTNTGSIRIVSGTNNYRIQASDATMRCPLAYRSPSPRWTNNAVNTLNYYALTL